MIKENQRVFNAILHAFDGTIVLMAAVLAWVSKSFFDQAFTKTGVNSLESYIILALTLVPLLIVTYKSNGLYEPMRGQRFWFEALRIIQSNVVCFSLLLIAIYFLKLTEFSRAGIILFFTNTVILTVFERSIIRFFLRYIRKQGFNQKHLIIVGTGKLARQFRNRVRKHKEFGINIIGFIGEPTDDFNVMGSFNSLEQILATRSVDEVVIALQLQEYPKLASIINVCEKHGVRTLVIPDYVQYVPARPQIIEFEDIPMINIREVPLDSMSNKIIKRAMDFALALLFIIISGPALIAIAIGIKLSSPGPILFTQERLGLGGRPFMMYKFRSMRAVSDNSGDIRWTVENDPRRTKLGEFIRKTSLDEIPQFFNVLKGDMSMIGPRPERPFFVDKFKEEVPKYMVKHQVKPGITGWAQVNGWRGDTSILERIKCDLYYIENWSIWLDMKIIFLTALKGLVNKNAY